MKLRVKICIMSACPCVLSQHSMTCQVFFHIQSSTTSLGSRSVRVSFFFFLISVGCTHCSGKDGEEIWRSTICTACHEMTSPGDLETPSWSKSSQPFHALFPEISRTIYGTIFPLIAAFPTSQQMMSLTFRSCSYYSALYRTHAK